MKTRFRVSRRSFLQHSAVSGAALVSGFSLLHARTVSGQVSRVDNPLGPLRPTRDQNTGLNLLELPEGFSYRTFGWTEDMMSDGIPTPAMHDGMAVISQEGNTLHLIRNHELGGAGPAFGSGITNYDPRAQGGCTALAVDARTGELISSHVALSGTVRNCAGGPTPWGTWLTCEETVAGPGEIEDEKPQNYTNTHGWVFEVDPTGTIPARPIKGMGRFWHEAVAVDPETGIVYETEDRSTGGFYRFVPHQPGQLHQGGVLEMMAVEGLPDSRRGVSSRVGEKLDVSWVKIEDPEETHSDENDSDTLGVFAQGKEKGGTTFARVEGCFYIDSKIYFTCTDGGEAQMGQLWRYWPETSEVELIYESNSPEALAMPDNITVSQSGLIILCEDSDRIPQRMMGLNTAGQLFEIARNNVQLQGEHNNFQGDFREQEWAGTSFSPDGRFLFVNIQTPGITFAIQGPWDRMNA